MRTVLCPAAVAHTCILHAACQRGASEDATSHQCDNAHTPWHDCPAGPAELREHLQKFSGKPFSEALSDFHLLLYLAGQPNFDLASDISHIVEAVTAKADVGEGYHMIIESIAGI